MNDDGKIPSEIDTVCDDWTKFIEAEFQKDQSKIELGLLLLFTFTHNH